MAKTKWLKQIRNLFCLTKQFKGRVFLAWLVQGINSNIRDSNSLLCFCSDMLRWHSVFKLSPLMTSVFLQLLHSTRDHHIRGTRDWLFPVFLFENKETLPRILQHTSLCLPESRIASYAMLCPITSQGKGTMQMCGLSAFRWRVLQCCRRERQPLQYSCLGNPTDRGGWWAIVHRLTKSRTQLSNWTQNMVSLGLCEVSSRVTWEQTI